MGNILFVSMSAPPQKGAESIQVGRYLKYLSDKYSIELVTSNTPNYGWKRADHTISNKTGNYKRIELKVHKNRANERLHSLFSTKTLEDRFVQMNHQVIKALTQKPDLIYSRAVPHGSSLLAKELATYFKVPWIMHMSDPWADNPYVITDQIDQSKEAGCVTLADYITLTSELAVNFYKEKYPAHKHKFVLMPNVYDEKLILETPKLSRSKHLTLTYTGNFYGKRNPESLLKILSNLERKGVLNGVRILFAGENDEHTKNIFKKYPIAQIEVAGSVSLEKSRQMQLESDVLLVIDKEYENPQDLTFLPSKILDYCSTGKPILAITPPGSSTEQFILKYGCGMCFSHNNLIQLENYISKMTTNFNNNNEIPASIAHPPKEFGARYNVDRLETLINQAMSQ